VRFGLKGCCCASGFEVNNGLNLSLEYNAGKASRKLSGMDNKKDAPRWVHL